MSDWHIYGDRDELAVDAVGRYETLDSDLARFLQRVGIETEGLTLPGAKAGVRKARTLYTAATADHVRRVFWREIERFGYSPPPELLG